MEDIQIIEIFKKAEELFSIRQFESPRKELGKVIAIDPDIFEAHYYKQGNTIPLDIQI